MTRSTSLSGKTGLSLSLALDDCHNISVTLYRRSTVTGYDFVPLISLTIGANRLLLTHLPLLAFALSRWLPRWRDVLVWNVACLPRYFDLCRYRNPLSLAFYLLFGGTAVIGGGIAFRVRLTAD